MTNKLTNLLDYAAFYELVSSAEKVYGPYRRQDGRQIVIIKNDDGSSRTVSWPKHIMEKHLGRPLDPNSETVDHLDFNKDNNDLSNLRIVPRDEHSADDTRRVKNIKLNCSFCKKEFERSPRLIRDKSKKGVGGQFCSRQCAGRYSRQLQLGLIDKMESPAYVESEYYRRKNIQAFSEFLIQKYGILLN